MCGLYIMFLLHNMASLAILYQIKNMFMFHFIVLIQVLLVLCMYCSSITATKLASGNATSISMKGYAFA